MRQASWVFDFDAVWSKEPHYFKYDFNEPTTVPPELHHTFDCLVIDPPFITQEVWAKYAATAQLLLAPGGKVIATTVAENHQLLADLMEGMRPCLFKPSIPHLIYQYNLFTNYDSATFSKRNPEIPEDD